MTKTKVSFKKKKYPLPSSWELYHEDAPTEEQKANLALAYEFLNSELVEAYHEIDDGKTAAQAYINFSHSVETKDFGLGEHDTESRDIAWFALVEYWSKVIN